MKTKALLLGLLMVGCAGMERSCATVGAENFGADWVVAQLGLDGRPVACWKLSGVSITNEPGSDGIYWKNADGHLVHISGWYNRVQVSGGDYGAAALAIGVSLKACTGGRYVEPAAERAVP